MNQAQKKAMEYARVINNMVQKTQEVQERLNPQFETIKTALDSGKVADMKADEYTAIKVDFQKGTDEYKAVAETLHVAKSPAKLMGMHHNLATAYDRYAQACQDMVDSMKDTPEIDKSVFEAAEKNQEEASDEISKFIQKISQQA